MSIRNVNPIARNSGGDPDDGLAPRRSCSSVKRVTRHKDADVAQLSGLKKIFYSDGYEAFVGGVVLLNFGVVTIETQARATFDNDVLAVTSHVNRMFLAFYSFECALRFYIMGWRSFRSAWNNFDVFIVVTGLVTEILEMLMKDAAGTGGMYMLKSLRMLRLVRLVRLLVAFHEIYVLIAGLYRGMKTLFCAACLIFMVLNVWSILSVEYLASIAEDLDETGEFGLCSWCGTAFSNVWLANLTWLQIVSGDGWSSVARGIIETHPWTVSLFVTNIVIVMWGLLNLVVGAIVESGIQAREDDIAYAAGIADQEEELAFHKFSKICANIDKSGDGVITTEELKSCWMFNTELQQHLAAMGVTEDSLDGLLNLMDEDKNGILDNKEFVQQFTRMRTLNMRTALFYLVKYVEKVHELVGRQGRMLSELTRTQSEDLFVPRGSRDQFFPRGSIDQFVPRGSIDQAATTDALQPDVRMASPDVVTNQERPDSMTPTSSERVQLTSSSRMPIIDELKSKPNIDGAIISQAPMDFRDLGSYGRTSSQESTDVASYRRDRDALQQRFDALTKELDRKFENMAKRFDLLPEAVTTEILIHASNVFAAPNGLSPHKLPSGKGSPVIRNGPQSQWRLGGFPAATTANGHQHHTALPDRWLPAPAEPPFPTPSTDAEVVQGSRAVS